MTEKELRAKVVATAVAWLGRKESDGSHREIIDIYNAHKPLAVGYRVKYTDAWCSTYASAVAIKAGLTDIIPTECGCERHINLFKKMGRWVENDAYTPAPGDYVFYNWDDGDNYATTDMTASADHVGIVTAVSGKNVTVIEGNKGNAVAYRTIKVNGKYIRGYGVPDYAGKAKETGGTEEATIYKVVKGDTLGRIAAAAGTTVQALAKINGIKNVNFIRVGQILMMENTIRAAVDKLATMGVINSPDYWEQTAAEVQHLDELLKMSAQVIKKAGKRAATPEAGVEKLVKVGIITSPEYWLTKVNTVKNLGALLTALGGAV